MGKPTYKAPAAYSSAYADQISGLLGQVVNRGEFSYNPLEDANYQQLAKVYNANGLKAQQDTLGQAAALNGGYGSSYAVTAAAQARNDYNQQLAALIPELEQNAYSRWADNYNMNLSTIGALQDADDTAYGRYRDTVSDKYTQYRDKMSDYQWQKEYNLSKKRAGSSGGGSSGGYYSSSGSGGNTTVTPTVTGTRNDPSGQVGKGAVSKNHKATGKSSSYYGTGKYKTSTNKNKKKTATTTKYRAVGKTAVRVK